VILPSGCDVQWLEQVHGSRVVVINEQVNSPIQADAMITRSPKIALAIMTADCLPILLSNSEGTEVAAIHGGWRSLADNIIPNTLAKMESHSDELHAWLGPCIGPEKFEVGREVKATFMQQNKLFSQAFEEKNIDVALQNASPYKKYLANLQLISQIQLQQLGIKNITSLPECTYSQKDKYYSFRREQVTGRMATIISRN
jgi:YfiH family protein